MVNWQNPVVINADLLALTKLDHVVAGIYIWETVFTASFELDVLRGKRPYRWTIWLYLGTRYTALLAFILYFIGTDGGKVSCQPFGIALFALAYASWTFASLIMVLRVIAIWNHKRLVKFLAVGLWLVALALNIYSLTTMEVSYNATLRTCIILGLRKCLLNAISSLTVDLMLLMGMLIGLLRHVHRSSTGIWRLLYQQCIAWIAVACIGEVPFLVFIILNLNNPMNNMLTGVEMTILSIGAARMYRGLCERGTFSESISSQKLQVTTRSPLSTPRCTSASENLSSIRFATTTKSSGTVGTSDAAVFMPTDHVRVKFISGASNLGSVDEDTKTEATFETV
ncbi:hypothetical protein BGW80DRAFT_381135 [Lactifluus volemus]|nr:hypothetical protein BGW80DRAFT_381135 [Lactifluus volemus]